MTQSDARGGEHLLVYEPRSEGHHPGWLRFITEDLLSAGWKLTLAVDQRPEAEARIRDHLGELCEKVTMMSAGRETERWWQAKARVVANCLKRSGAAKVFLCALDEIASDCWRRAAFGIYPPKSLRGRMGGIYHRPRFLGGHGQKAGHVFKQTGYERLIKDGWLQSVLFVDEYIAREQQQRFPDASIFFLPDPCPPASGEPMDAARRQLEIPDNRRVFLFYGGGYRRKGLHLAVDAMLKLPAESPAFLLCAGKLSPEGETALGLRRLESAGRAKLIDRFVSVVEEQTCFAASDVVLLPYVHHFGTSGVLSRAMAAGRMVIVSDEELLGRLTRDHGLGLLFPSGDVAALRDRIQEAAQMPHERLGDFARAAAKYAAAYSREAYRRTLIRALAPQNMPSHA